MNKTVGILAHVDAGKTTLSEQVLFRTGALRSAGRVDHKDAFLDSHPIERRRGITVFSDQACFPLGSDTCYWLDTPGHVDFSAEMERCIAVMDTAVLVVSCAEGVQSHTETVWHLLREQGIPVFLFLNKTDRAGADREKAIAQIRRLLSSDVIDMTNEDDGDPSEAFRESVAERDEIYLEKLLGGGDTPADLTKALRRAIRNRALFPLCSGSALQGEGVTRLLTLLDRLAPAAEGDPAAPFSARVYRIRHDAQGAKICFLKVLSGTLRVRDAVGEDRVTELRRYQGPRYAPVRECGPGELCGAVGLSAARIGEVIGDTGGAPSVSRCEPMLRSRVEFDPPVRTDAVLKALRELEEEDPSLSVEAEGDRIELSLMGAIQTDVLKELLAERFSLPVRFGPPRILYRETIAAPVVGVGHYEPLRHYAEVHLRLLPGERGSGIRFESLCHVDDLSLNWQRLIETHVFEKKHKGVLTGAPLTDLTVQLLSGRDHLKHTEGGDFRQAVYRAIRQGLMQAKSILLEPVCTFSIRAPKELFGKITGDLTRMRAECDPPVYEGESMTLTGTCTFREISAYGESLTALSRGRGLLSYRADHYEPADHAEEIIAQAAYDPEADDTPDSVFCSHGAGFVVHWQHVPEWAHLPVEPAEPEIR